MLLSIFNLPMHVTYPDVKELIRLTCGLKEVIVDNLVRDGQSMKVTVGVMEDADAAIIVRKISGMLYQGQKLFVQDKRQKQDTGPQQPNSYSQYDQQPNQFLYNAAAQYQMQYAMPAMYGQMANIAMMYPATAGVISQNSYTFGQQGQIGAPQTPAPVPQPYNNAGSQSYNQQYNQQPQSWGAGNNLSTSQERSTNLEQESSRDRDSKRDPYKSDYKDSRSSSDDRDVSRGTSRRDRQRSLHQQSDSSRRDDSNRGRPQFDHKPSFRRDDTRNDSNNSFGGPSFDKRPPRDVNTRSDPNKPFGRPAFDQKPLASENNTRNIPFNRPPLNQNPSGRMDSLNDPNKPFVRPSFDQRPSTSGFGPRNDSNQTLMRPTAPQNVDIKRKFDNPNSTFEQNNKSRFGPPVPQNPSRPKSVEPLDMQRVRGLHRNAPEQFIQQQYDRRQTNRCLMQCGGHVATVIKQNVQLKDKYACMGDEFVKQLKAVVGQTVRERVYNIISGNYSLSRFEVLELYRKNYNEDDDIPFVDSLARNLEDAVRAGRPFSNTKAAIDSMSHLTKRKRSQLKKREKKLNMSIRQMSRSVIGPRQPIIPAHPMGNFKIAKKNKFQSKQDLFTLEPHPMAPAVANALHDEVEEISKLFYDEFANPRNIRAGAVYKVVDQDACVIHLTKYLKFKISRRMADVGEKMLRIYGRPHLPKREDLEQFLLKYECISLKKNKTGVFYIASFRSYKSTDALVKMACVTLGEKQITADFKYLLDAPKPPKLKYKDITKVRQNRIQSLIDKSNVNLLAKDWQEQQAAEDERRKKEMEPRKTKKQAQNCSETDGNKEETVATESTDLAEDVIIESTENDSESTTKPENGDSQNVEQNPDNEVSDETTTNVADDNVTETIKTDENTSKQLVDAEKSDKTTIEDNDMFDQKVLKNFHVIDEITGNNGDNNETDDHIADKDIEGDENEEWDETGDWDNAGENDDDDDDDKNNEKVTNTVSLADINDDELDEDDFVDY